MVDGGAQVPRVGAGRGLPESDGRIDTEAAARGQVDLTLVSVDSTVARAYQDAAGMAVSGEVLDALEAAFTEEKGVPLQQ